MKNRTRGAEIFQTVPSENTDESVSVSLVR